MKLLTYINILSISEESWLWNNIWFNVFFNLLSLNRNYTLSTQLLAKNLSINLIYFVSTFLAKQLISSNWFKHSFIVIDIIFIWIMLELWGFQSSLINSSRNLERLIILFPRLSSVVHLVVFRLIKLNLFLLSKTRLYTRFVFYWFYRIFFLTLFFFWTKAILISLNKPTFISISIPIILYYTHSMIKCVLLDRFCSFIGWIYWPDRTKNLLTFNQFNLDIVRIITLPIQDDGIILGIIENILFIFSRGRYLFHRTVSHTIKILTAQPILI